MTLADYRSAGRRRSRLPIVGLTSATLMIVAAVMFGVELINYSDRADSLGSDVTIGGVQVGGLAESDRVAALEDVYVEQPIYLDYNGDPILLYPSEIGFQLDTDGMQAEATRQASNRDTFWEGFWSFLWRESQPALELDLIANYSETELDEYLQDLASRYGTSSSGPGFNVVNLTFGGSSSNTQLDIQAAKPLIAAALFEIEAENRRITLPTVTTEGETLTMNTLRQALINFMESHGVFYDGNTSVVSMFVLDLETGEEIGILENVKHSAASTIKLGVLINFFRDKITAPTDDEKYQLAAAVICSNNGAANNLMYATSDDDTFADGPRNTTETMCRAGAGNSAIRSNLYVGSAEELSAQGISASLFYSPVPETPCPSGEVAGNEVDTSVQPYHDPLNYTTAADMGTLLMLTYECAMNGGGLMLAFPDEITQTECQQILELLRGTNFERFSELGAPDTVRISHKVGYNDETVADIGIVYSPGGDYVFVIYFWEEDTNNNGLTEIPTWDLIGDLARIVYNYFNPEDPLLQTRTPVNAFGGAACVLPYSGAEINLTNIDQNRFDGSGNPLNSACYDYPGCRPFDNWGRGN